VLRRTKKKDETTDGVCIWNSALKSHTALVRSHPGVRSHNVMPEVYICAFSHSLRPCCVRFYTTMALCLATASSAACPVGRGQNPRRIPLCRANGMVCIRKTRRLIEILMFHGPKGFESCIRRLESGALRNKHVAKYVRSSLSSHTVAVGMMLLLFVAGNLLLYVGKLGAIADSPSRGFQAAW
jgi:hypothetical protein